MFRSTVFCANRERGWCGMCITMLAVSVCVSNAELHVDVDKLKYASLPKTSERSPHDISYFFLKGCGLSSSVLNSGA